MVIESSKHWTDYWNKGFLTSLPQDFPANYDGNIAKFWHQSFSELKEQDKILDICTGNGAIAVLAAEYSYNRKVLIDIKAVDAAHIDRKIISSRYSQNCKYLDRVDFFGNTHIEKLPFNDSEFALITSQFGFEYCLWERGAKELSRVLTDDGKLIIVRHSHDSNIINFMMEEKREYELVFESKIQIFIENYFFGKFSLEELNKKMEKIRKFLILAKGNKLTPVIDSFIRMIEYLVSLNIVEFEQQKGKIGVFFKEMENARLRVLDLIRVSNEVEDEEKWNRVFEKNKFVCIDSGHLMFDNLNKVGDYFVMTKVGK